MSAQAHQSHLLFLPPILSAPIQQPSKPPSRAIQTSPHSLAPGIEQLSGMMTLLCATLSAPTVDQLARDMATAKSLGADLVELRLDLLSAFDPRSDLQLLLTACPLPAIVVYRPKRHGGQYDGDDAARLQALRIAVDLGAEYVDVELASAQEFVSSISSSRPDGFKLIVSSHYLESTPSSEDLSSLVASIQAAGADVVRIATHATDITDVARVLQLLAHSHKHHVPVIASCAGERGLISRLLCPKFGGYLTFSEISESAPGQPNIPDFLNVFNFRHIGIDTKVFGLIGKPVAYSKSPIFHNAVFKVVGFNGVYVPLLVDDITNFIRVYSSPDFAGFSCTKPHKETAVTLCDEVDPVAESIGAVNTIIRRPEDGKLIGYNTDYIGAISAIEDGIRGSSATDEADSPLNGRIFVVIGAGGAGKALAYGAKVKGAKVVIANRTFARAKELADSVGADALSLAELENFHPEDGMVLANTTSIGMYPNTDETPVPKHALKNYAVVFDAVYTPQETRLLKEAEESGVGVVSGVEMFIRQAMGQFELFTGMPAPEALMRDILKRIS